MFTGIIESIGEIIALDPEGGNLHITLQCDFTHELKIDQSLAHDGVCLTVVAINGDQYTVTAIEETLDKTNLSHWQVGGLVNLERAMQLGDRLDGHIVQGHVDLVGSCTLAEEKDGSWHYLFAYDKDSGHVTVSKGSITINGVSLTVVNSAPGLVGVAIIPYTYEHTNFKAIEAGSAVNLEFDIIGKYVSRISRGYAGI
jgi:riboflavin synthase